jgi:CRP/FNR family transcriptional regulator, cyclic AMP receptor protein
LDTFRYFTSKYPVKTFKKGETILLKDEKPKCLFIIESGHVKTYSITKNGNERLVSIDKKDEEFPIGYTFGLIERSEYFYEAFTRCTVRMIPRDEYITYLSSNIERAYASHVRITRLLLATLSHIHALEQPSAGEKIAHTLVYMGKQLGIALRPHKTDVNLSVTQQEIANSLGITRETANVELKKLEALKLITYTRKSYILHMEQLQEYLEKK